MAKSQSKAILCFMLAMQNTMKALLTCLQQRHGNQGKPNHELLSQDLTNAQKRPISSMKCAISEP
eukprot:4850500-Pleurochrysis_carterae.AAC.1